LAFLIKKLNRPQIFYFGISSGARVGLYLAVRKPELFQGLVLMPPTGGVFAANVLSKNYYMQYALMAKNGGMREVAGASFFRELISKHEQNGVGGSRDKLLKTSSGKFIETMRASAEILSSTSCEPVLGVTATEMASLKMPLLVIHNGDTVDKIHTVTTAKQAAQLLPNARYLQLEKYSGFSEATASFTANCLATNATVSSFSLDAKL
jgi:pimeloyl-ACP methyl ester carboxylesterase